MPIASIQFQFDVSAIEVFVGGGGTPVPRGWYLAPISDMKVVENNGKNGHNLALVYTIQGPDEFKGRKLYNNLNLWHQTSSGAVEIAQKQLSSIGHAVGILSGGDLAVLGEKPMLVEVDLEEATPETPDPNTGNMIKGRPARNVVLQHKAATPENIALYLNGQPQNSGAAPQFTQQAQAAAANAAPAFNPAFNPAAPAQAQQAPAFNQQAAPAPANAAPQQGGQVPSQAVPTGTPGASTPPWLANKAA